MLNRRQYKLLRAKPAWDLENLRKVPITMVMVKASYLARFLEFIIKSLKQCRVEVDHLEIVREGITGSSHEIFFLEKNNLEIAAKVEKRILRWLI